MTAKEQGLPEAVYGYCPTCGAKGAMRERRPNGNDKCENGHTYPSRQAVSLSIKGDGIAETFARLDHNIRTHGQAYFDLMNADLNIIRAHFAALRAQPAVQGGGCE